MAIDTTLPRSRRSLLTGVLGGLAGAAAATLAGAQRVLAAGDDGAVIHVGDTYFGVGSLTWLDNSANDINVFAARNTAGGIGVIGYSGSSDGVKGQANSGTGVHGQAFTNPGLGVHGEAPYVAIKGESNATGSTGGSGVGVFGSSMSDDGAGVDGRGPNVGVHGRSAGTGVFGQGTGGGIGLLGNSDSYRAVVGVVSATSGPTIGVMGESFSSAGTGVRGWAAGGATGVVGFSGSSFPSAAPPARTGVYGNAPRGRGVVASGGTAQLRLVPSSASTHPSSGALGDLFLDKAGRLWFCKGGARWKQIA